MHKIGSLIVGQLKVSLAETIPLQPLPFKIQLHSLCASFTCFWHSAIIFRTAGSRHVWVHRFDDGGGRVELSGGGGPV